MKTINLLVLVLGILMAPAQIFSQYNGVQEIRPEAVAAAIEQGALFVDVRETNESEVLAYDVIGAINLPLSELPDRLAELPLDRPIVLACTSGKRSSKAATILLENNFTQLFNLTGGVAGWEKAGLPLLKKARVTETTTPTNKKQCCSSKEESNTNGQSCCGKKTDAGSEKASCGGAGKGKGKSCCAGGSR